MANAWARMRREIQGLFRIFKTLLVLATNRCLLNIHVLKIASPQSHCGTCSDICEIGWGKVEQGSGVAIHGDNVWAGDHGVQLLHRI